MTERMTRNSDHHVVVEDDTEQFAFDTQAQDRLELAAATWFARWMDGLDSQGKAQLRAWLDADPAHATAWRDMKTSLDAIRQLPDERVAKLKAGTALVEGNQTRAAGGPVQASTLRPRSRTLDMKAYPASQGRRTPLFDLVARLPRAATITAVVVAAGGGWLGWSTWWHQPVFTHGYATLRGQQTSITLPDGSRLQLDTATRADVRLFHDRREVHLTDGQAMFDVQADPARPFHVLAGPLRVTVVGTRFSVRHTGTGIDQGSTRVAVEEGRVRVARSDASHGTSGTTMVATHTGIELTAGQTVATDGEGTLGTVAILPSAAVAPWRHGRLSFDNTPLTLAIEEFERYGKTDVVIRDPAVAGMRVGGSFNIQEFRTFQQLLPQLLPVRLEHHGNTVEIVARAPAK